MTNTEPVPPLLLSAALPNPALLQRPSAMHSQLRNLRCRRTRRKPLRPRFLVVMANSLCFNNDSLCHHDSNYVDLRYDYVV